MTPEQARDGARRAFAARFGDLAEAREWWVPGRIELLGKHVDYGGGRSLLIAVDRGIHVLARPRRDHRVHLTDARSRLSFSGRLDAGQPTAPGRWTNYPISVLRRIARDFPGSQRGMDAVLASSLPSAAGMSSSSAVIIAAFLPMAAFNALDQTAAWQQARLADPGALPGYLGAIENGLAFGPFGADFGVGTLGGSQDHTAITAAEAGRVVQYRFLPVQPEGSSPVPAEWQFVVLSTGVSAPKAGAVRERYNQLATEMHHIIACWNRHQPGTAISLLDVLRSAPDAGDQLAAHLRRDEQGDQLVARLRQFEAETLQIIPAVRRAFDAADHGALGAAVARSQHLAETVLRNQVPETRHVVRSATQLGAMAASAFGAGFGGSVWALVERREAEEFAAAWLAEYRGAFPSHTTAASVFVTDAAAGAHEVG
ncbi:MAG TPA: galactokinase family protein [Gemmatimonadales bacterium]|nr:galactokinase family protein [Gemmatimonadales bacterium]